ncbi:complement decay-accelerating factor isoform X6 [Desmodus rotundus]|uniref:complement decay-accelerating factor isoform X6 n=1 Tax=Desmodus rotundus TaxID=9430 RepID=UPI002381254C|nr:complement decay-accelerating factor isoform X6 [Desmodus rotundus]
MLGCYSQLFAVDRLVLLPRPRRASARPLSRAMNPTWRGVPEVLGRLDGLTLLLPLLLLLLLLCPHASRGDCKVPPDVPNAQAALSGLTSFPERHIVTYKCNEGFVKVPGKPDSVICLKGNEWSQIAEFCNRSCDVPTRLLFASLKNPYNRQNYFPVGSIVEYDCRMGYKRDQSLSGNLTCLQNFTWSQPDEFCKKKSCPNPGEIINGRVNIKTDILFGASITFSCNTGYKLVGATSSYCIVSGENVDWSDPLPECKGSSPISKVIPTPQKPTTVAVSGTKAPSTSQKPTTVAVSATRSTAVPRATTPFRARSTPKGKGIPSAGVSNIICGLVTGAIITGILILGKIFWDRGKSGTHICNTDSFAYDASSQWLFDLAKEEIRRKCTQVHRPLLVSYKLLEPWTQYMQSCSSFCMLSLSLRCIEMSLKQEETNLS